MKKVAVHSYERKNAGGKWDGQTQVTMPTNFYCVTTEIYGRKARSFNLRSEKDEKRREQNAEISTHMTGEAHSREECQHPIGPPGTFSHCYSAQ